MTEYTSIDAIKKLTQSTSLTDVMVQAEDFLDSLDLYAMGNWLDGEIVDGPYVKRYWVKFTLKYPRGYKQAPQRAGIRRLRKFGALVKVEKAEELLPREVQGPDDLTPEQKPKMDKHPVWLIHIQIPRRFIEQRDDENLELYTDAADVDVDDVESAEDTNSSAENALNGELDFDNEEDDDFEF